MKPQATGAVLFCRLVFGTVGIRCVWSWRLEPALGGLGVGGLGQVGSQWGGGSVVRLLSFPVLSELSSFLHVLMCSFLF